MGLFVPLQYKIKKEVLTTNLKNELWKVDYNMHILVI